MDTKGSAVNLLDQADRKVLASGAIIIMAMALCVLSITVVAALAVRLFLYLSGI